MHYILDMMGYGLMTDAAGVFEESALRLLRFSLLLVKQN
jgi:hypothetical protein